MTAAKPPAPDAPKYATLQQVAALLKEPPERIPALMRKEGLPTAGRGKFDLTRVIHWQVDNSRRKLQELQDRRDERTLPEIAHLFRKDPRTVTKHAKLDGLPRDDRGIYNLQKVVPWMVEFWEKQIREVRTGGESESQARKRLYTANANLKEMELGRLRKEVVARTDIELQFGPLVKAARDKILGRSRKIAPQLQGLTPTEVEALLLKYDSEALQELAQIPNLLSSKPAA
jgi:hypothetical protein